MEQIISENLCWILYDWDNNDEPFLYYQWFGSDTEYKKESNKTINLIDNTLNQDSTWNPEHPKTSVPIGKMLRVIDNRTLEINEPKDIDVYFNDFKVIRDINDFISECKKIEHKYD